MIAFRIALFLVCTLTLASSLTTFAGEVDPQVKARCFSAFREMRGCLLIQLYKDKLPALYNSYLDICRTRARITRLIADLKLRRNQLSNRSAVSIIDEKIGDLIQYDAALVKSLATLEMRAYELILTQYALQVVPDSIDDATRAKLREDVNAELESTSTIMKQINEDDAEI